MIVQLYNDYGHLHISSKSGDYVFMGVLPREYKLVKKYIRLNWIGRAWKLLKKHRWYKMKGDNE